MNDLRHEKWAGTTYGNGFMHRWLVRFLRVIDVRILYLFCAIFVVPPTFLVNSKARKSAYSYFRGRHGMGKMRAVWNAFRNQCEFSKVVIDKFAMYAGKKFRIDIDGYDHFLRLSDGESGFVQLSSHIGNYEIGGYSLVAEKKRFNALVFGGEKDTVMQNRSKFFDSNNIRMIAVREDMSHLFEMDKALSDGEILSMPADRIFGSPKSYSIPFLGKEAAFPQGPFTMAAVRNVPVLFVAVMKSGAKSYRIIVEELPKPQGKTSRQRAEELARSYVAHLERVIAQYPLQWYNYFDFWKEYEF